MRAASLNIANITDVARSNNLALVCLESVHWVYIFGLVLRVVEKEIEKGVWEVVLSHT